MLHHIIQFQSGVTVLTKSSDNISVTVQPDNDVIVSVHPLDVTDEQFETLKQQTATQGTQFATMDSNDMARPTSPAEIQQ